jgi:hypothetical protein
MESSFFRCCWCLSTVLCALLGFQHAQWTIYQIVKYVDVFSAMIHSTRIVSFIYTLSRVCYCCFIFGRLFSWALVRSLTHYENIISSLFCVIFFLFISLFLFLSCSIHNLHTYTRNAMRGEMEERKKCLFIISREFLSLSLSVAKLYTSSFIVCPLLLPPLL